METRERNVRPARKRLLWTLAILLLAAVAVIGNRQRLSSVSPNPIFIKKAAVCEALPIFLSSTGLRPPASQTIKPTTRESEKGRRARYRNGAA